MDYHRSYILMNYKKKDPTLPLSFDNMALIRPLDGSKAEAGFILSHVAINVFSGELVGSIQEISSICENIEGKDQEPGIDLGPNQDCINNNEISSKFHIKL